MYQQMVWTALLLAIGGSLAACSSHAAKLCLDGASPDGGPVIAGDDTCPDTLAYGFSGKCDGFKLGLTCPAGDGPACRCACMQCGASKAWVCVDIEPETGCNEE